MSPFFLFILMSSGLLLLFTLLTLLLFPVPKKIHATVSALSWERSIVIEHGVWVSSPRRTKLHTYYNYAGSYWMNRPVDEDEVLRWRWRYRRTLSSSGESQMNVSWPDSTLASHERYGKRKEQYHASFTTVDGKHFRVKLKKGIWEKLDTNAYYLLKRTVFSRITRIDRIQTDQAIQDSGG